MTISELKQEDRELFEELYKTCFRSFLPHSNDSEIAERGWNKAKQYIRPKELDRRGEDPEIHKSDGGTIYRSFAAHRSPTPNKQSTLIGCLLPRSYTVSDPGRKMDNEPMVEPYSYVQNLIVDTESRRRGVARTLMDVAEDYVRYQGTKRMALYTFPYLEAAVGLYRSLENILQEADEKVKVPTGQEGRQLWIKDIALVPV